MNCACGCGQHARPNGRYASDACRARDWKVKHNYGPQGPRKGRSNGSRRKSREGRGVRPYLSTNEALELLKLPIPASVRAKLESKLQSAELLPGQLDIVTELEGQNAARNA